MVIFEWVRLIVGTAFLIAGLVIFVLQILGVYRLDYVLNRMHAAAMGDTLGIAVSFVGLMILSGFRFATLKMGLVIVFLWIASPVSSHLIARLEATTNEELSAHCDIIEEQEEA